MFIYLKSLAASFVVETKETSRRQMYRLRDEL